MLINHFILLAYEDDITWKYTRIKCILIGSYKYVDIDCSKQNDH